MHLSIQRHFRDRFPGIASIKEEISTIEQVTRKTIPGGSFEETSQRVIKILHNGSEESIWNRLEVLREDLKVGDRELAIHHVETVPEDRLKNLTQAIFRLTDTQVTIYTTAARRATKKKKTPGTSRSKPKERNTMAFIVEVGDRTFKDVLKGVR